MIGYMNAGYPTLDLDMQLCFPLYATTRAVTRKYTELLAEVGLTYPQYLVMLALWAGSPQTVGDLGVRLGLDSGTLTPLLKRLAQQGLVERRRGQLDERVVRIHLTAAGRALRGRARKIPAALAGRAGFDVASARSLRDLVRLREELTELARRMMRVERSSDASLAPPIH